MTSQFHWVPRSNTFYNVTRSIVNKVAPAFRNQFPLPILDGPLAEQSDAKLVLHEKTVASDPFQYMEDLFDRRTQTYLKQEQRHTALSEMRYDVKHLKARIWAELDAKTLVTSREGGFDKGEERIGDYLYFTRVVPGHDNQALGFYRKKYGEVDLLGEELINPRVLQQQFGYSHCTVGVCRVSQDGVYLGYTLSVEGGDRFICHIRSIENASLFHVIRGSNIISIDFGASNQFYFTECNELNRPHRVVLQEIRPGLLPQSIEVYRDDDESAFVDVRKTKDNQFMIFASDSKLASNIVVLPAQFPTIPKSLAPFFPERKGVEICDRSTWNWVEHYKGYFIRVTGDQGANYRIVYCRVEVALKEGLKAQWKELVPLRPDVSIGDVDLFEDRIIVYEVRYNFERVNFVRIIDLAKGLDAAAASLRSEDIVLHFPPLAAVTPGLNKNINQKEINFVYSSIIQPPKDCVFSFESKNLNAQKCLLSAPQALYTQRQSEHFTPWDYMWPYSIYRDVCVSHDGTQIPITICQRRDAFVQEATDFEPQPNNPKHCLIYVYGSYGEVPSMHFQLAPWMWLIRRRWTVAFAHVRGGGEFNGWADAGKREHKINSTMDFVACCDHLVQQGYTKPEMMVACGNSAGCLPIAAAMNLRGNSLFGNALMRSPFLDVTNTMIDPDLPLSIVEREDWGDPLNKKDDLERILQYDPYHNINDRVTYPGMIVSACLDDDRVPAWNALKYVAKLRHQRLRRNTDPVASPIILRAKNSGGHHFWNDTENICEELVILSTLLDLEGPGKVMNDMDMMTHINNLHSAGIVDTDDAEKVFLKWDNWERERVDYHKKLHAFTWEPNFRKLKADKQPFFWVPTEGELSQSVADEQIDARERKMQSAGRGTGAQPGTIGMAAGKNHYTKK